MQPRSRSFIWRFASRKWPDKSMGTRERQPLRSSLEAKVVRQPVAFDNLIMRDQQVFPRLAVYSGRVFGSMLAPTDGGSGLALYFRCRQILPLLRFHHQDGVLGLCDEVGDVFGLLAAMLVVHLELALGRLEPFQRIALQDDGEASLRVRVELLQ